MTPAEKPVELKRWESGRQMSPKAKRMELSMYRARATMSMLARAKESESALAAVE